MPDRHDRRLLPAPLRQRRQGVTAALIDSALAMAKRAGAPALEAYPFDAAVSPSATGTGYASTFLRAGFTEVARHVRPRPILRHTLKGHDVLLSGGAHGVADSA